TRQEAGPREAAAHQEAETEAAPPGPVALPRGVRQASLSPQLKEGPDRLASADASRTASGAGSVERDADEVRSRFASLQRGWQRGREKNDAGDDALDGSARGTT